MKEKYYICDPHWDIDEGGPMAVIFSIGDSDRDDMKRAVEALTGIFGENQEWYKKGYGSLRWRGRAWGIGLTSMPPGLEHLEDEIWDNDPIELPDTFDPDSIPDEHVFRLDCCGWEFRAGPTQVAFIAYSKYGDGSCCTTDISKLFLEP